MTEFRGTQLDLNRLREMIKSLPEVKDALVITTTNRRGESQLHGYVCFQEGKDLSLPALRTALTELLNATEIPPRFTIMHEMPYANDGKISFAELPPPGNKRSEFEQPFHPPETEQQKALAVIWKNILEIDEVGIDDDFFHLGGDASLLGELVTHMENLFERKIPPAFANQVTIRAMATTIQAAEQTAARNDELLALKQSITRKRAKLKEREFLITPEYTFVRLLVSGLDYAKTLRWVAALARKPFVKRIFAPLRAEFKAWYTLTGSNVAFESAFEGYLHNQFVNLLPFDHNFLHRDLNELFAEHLSARSKFQRTLSESFLDTPLRAEHPMFVMRGLEYFTSALDQGNGVILVTFHGNVRFPKFLDMEWISGSNPIETISFNLGHKGRYTSSGPLSEEQFSASNAGVALDARRQLAEGKAIFILSDTKDQRSKNYTVHLLGKEYQYKAGFAELSLITGSPIIPVYKYLLEDGRVVTEFLEQLMTNKSEIEDQVMDLLDQYTTFIADSWRKHPEAMRSKLVKEHLRHKG